MLTRLWSHDPALLLALVLCLAVCAAGICVFILGLVESRRSTITTAAALRQDAVTAERKRRLKVLQGRVGSRRAS